MQCAADLISHETSMALRRLATMLMSKAYNPPTIMSIQSEMMQQACAALACSRFAP